MNTTLGLHPASYRKVPGQYRSIARIVRRMRRAAQSGDWLKVAALDHDYRSAVETLRDLPKAGIHDRTARRGLLHCILKDDAHIRQLIAPELGRLARIIGGHGHQRLTLRARWRCIP